MPAEGGVLELLPTRRIRYGPGSAAGLTDALDRAGVTRAVVLCAASLTREGALLARVEQYVGDRLVRRIDDFPAHVPSAAVRYAAGIADAAEADGLVSFGGGSVIDATKAVAAAMADARGSCPPHIALPTTLAGAELASHYGVTQLHGGRAVKISRTREDVTPVEVIFDAMLTVATPDPLWAGTAVKALDHAIEGLLCRTAPRPLLDELAQTGIRGLAGSLEASLLSSGGSLQARQRCQVAAWHCYPAPASLVLGLSHRIGHILGGSFGVPHGVTSAITLPAVMHAMRKSAPAALQVVARALDTRVPLDLAEPAASDPDRAAPLLTALIERLGLPRRLRDVGVSQAEVGTVAELVAARFPASLDQLGNGGEAALRDLLAQAW
jgi:maleylacetate reductase